MNKVVVVGSRGQLGTELCLQLSDLAVGLDLPDFDLLDTQQVASTLQRIRPDVVINTAAYTQVDRAEEEADACFHVNADAVTTLADACREIDCVLVQVSTDYVFGDDTDRSVPYVETDEPGPLGVYGKSKLAGEQNAKAWRKHFIVRTAGLYAPARTGLKRGRNFVDTMLSLGSQTDRLNIVSDQICSTTFAPDLAAAIVYLIPTEAYGTYHVVNSGAVSWYDFAAEIFRLAGISITLSPITTEEYGAPAARPAYSVLSTEKYHRIGGSAMPAWAEALARYFQMQIA